ncbi:MAG: putative hemagglutinin-related autotransporter protein, partial [Verrucomicrobiaceae bacterium]|nr:putative hemagglutinin-related autotransporter protein [Verrucomicrobiaceae bacterium]
VYSQTCTASGGASPYVWTISAGTLPSGLTVTTAGVLSGTPTAPTTGVNGTSITLKATDANGCALTKAYNLKICPVIAITPATLNVGTVGTAYNQGLSASGGSTPYAWTLTSGTLPTGLSLNSGSGLISGTPTVSNGAGTAITVTATDVNVCPGTKNYTLKICPVISLSPSTMPAATVGTPYSQTAAASGGASPYVYTVSAGSLPAWASFNGTTGVISGTPNVTTSASFTITATDVNGCAVSLGYTISPSCPVITVTPATLPDGIVNGSYSQSLTAAGGVAPYNWAITTGSVPLGLSFSTAGALTGTPTAVGAYTFTARATDVNGCSGLRLYTVNVRSLRVGNLVWLDTNNNGLKDSGENGISGITVELWSAGPNSTEESGAGDDIKVKADVVTNASGIYQFTDIAPGSGYYVRIPSPPPTSSTTSGTPVNLDNQVDNDTNGKQTNPGDPLRSPLFALAAGAEPAAGVDGDDTDGELTIDFGLAPTVSVGNLVFKDINHNGAYDPGIDVVVDGVTLHLFASGDDPLSATPEDSTITSGGGLYLFSVRPGNYFVHIPPAMFAPGAPLENTAPTLTASTTLDDNVDQDLVPSAKPYAFGCNTSTFSLVLNSEPTSASGETGYQSASDDSYDTNADVTVDLGLFPLPSPTAPLAGRVRRDLSGTGDPSAAATPLPGVEVALYADANANGQLDASEMSAVATTTTDAAGAYVFEQVQAGDYVVVQTILAGAQATYDSDGGETDATAITVTDAPVVDVDFLQSLSPDTFAQWQRQHAASSNGASDNPDGDLYSNLLEYALGMDGAVSGKPHFNLEAGAANTIDAVLVRRSTGHNDILYSLEGSNDLVSWTKLNISPVFTHNVDGTETVRYQGVTSSFVRLKVDLDANKDGMAESTSTSPVFGWKSVELAAAAQTFSMPLLKPEVFAGKVGTATGSVLAPGSTYYGEVISGDLEGQRYEVDEAASTATAIAWESTPPPAEARIVIRAHWTVAELFPASLFHAGTSASNGDRVMFFDGPGYKVVWLVNRPSGPRWVRDGDATLADAGGLMVGPADGVVVNPRQAPVRVTLMGEVRAWKFAVPLRAGAQLIGAGYPLALSAADRGMDGAAGFIAATDSTSADRVQIWVGDTNPGSAAYTSYFYRQAGNLGSLWSGPETQDATTTKVFEAFRASYLISGAGTSGWSQPVPWKR